MVKEAVGVVVGWSKKETAEWVQELFDCVARRLATVTMTCVAVQIVQ